MARKEPIGTINRWESGEHMKIDDTINSKTNWLKVIVRKHVADAAREMDARGKDIMGYENPFQGKKLFDKMLADFYQHTMGWSKENARMVPSEMKELGGWHGSEVYSFYNYFSKVDMAARINEALKRKVEKNKEEIAAWENAFDSGKRAGERPNEVRPEWQTARDITKKELDGLLTTMDDALEVLERGTDFDGERNDAYHVALEKASTWKNQYTPIQEVMAEREAMIKTFDEVFTSEHDWVVKEGWDEQLEDHFQEYFKRYEEQIVHDEGERISEDMGTTFDVSTDEFYEVVRDKGQNLTDFEMTNLLKVRYAIFMKKRLDGKWTKENMAAVENFENIAHALPKGHVLTNKALNTFKNMSYVDGHGYAHYSTINKHIALSDEMLKTTTSGGKLTNKEEFFSVVPHEIGHAVQKAFENVHKVGYRHWTALCGWHFLQNGLNATAGDRPTPRVGPEKNRPLITEYSHMSPSEAFAEYYAAYSQNKEGIDKWIETGDLNELSMKDHLVQVSMPYYEEIKGAKGETRYIKFEKTGMVMGRGMFYRSKTIPSDVMVKNKELFAFMKNAVWGSAPLNKALIKQFGFSFNEA
jgi:hypothetical protein